MTVSRGFALVTAADFVVRSAYQMGKTPLLPIFAVSLGAGEAFLGFVVSVSTVTGMLVKPIVGLLSDRWGRKAWLLIGTGFFTFMPFMYAFVDSPGQLFVLRMVHGLATAIYGPVTLAYVAELSGKGRAERLGWFSSARSAGYAIGPLSAGVMMLWMDPVAIFTVIGVMSSIAFLPVALLPESPRPNTGDSEPVLHQAWNALRAVGTTPAVWLVGALNGKVLIAVYATKTFLPLQAHAAGLNMAVVGLFFGAQEVVHILLNPVAGRIGDRIGYAYTAGLGLVVLGVAVPLLTIAEDPVALMGPAVLMGLAQALVFPSTVALLSHQLDDGNLGAGMGVMGTLKNTAKVAGPVLVGFLLHWTDFATVFRLIGVVLLSAGGFVVLSAYLAGRPTSDKKRAAV